MTTIDDVYLPFSSEELTEHFAPVQSGGDVGKHLSYYKASAERARAYAESPPIGSPADLAKALKAARQMEKDERFWVVAALMSAFHASHRVTTLTALLACCLGQTPPMAGLASWADALGDPVELKLFFEVSLPSPKSYSVWLHDHLTEQALVPHIFEPAIKKNMTKLEGSTKADAMLIAPSTGVAIVFEAKVLSDISVHITFDAARNQLARNIDVLLDKNPNLANRCRSAGPSAAASYFSPHSASATAACTRSFQGDTVPHPRST